MKNLIPILFALGLLSSSCQRSTQWNDSDENAQSKIDSASYMEYMEILASDAFQGRLPGSPGEDSTIQYIKETFHDIGLAPGNGDDFLQEVPLVEVTSTPDQNWVVSSEKGNKTFKLSKDYVLISRQQNNIQVPNSELVFVGFGIVAPEYKWNDYKGIDVKGKTVVVMVNDPGYYDASLFKGETMTYYGRWTYKYEEAARQGAAGVMIIHNTGAASYGWNVVQSGWTGPQMTLDNDSGAPILSFEGWITEKTAAELFDLAGKTNQLLEDAKQINFKPVELGLTTSINLTNTVKHSKSHNVLGKIEGSTRPEEIVVYGGHWDHLGVGNAIDGDSIYNGAMDNATGIAGIFEIAKAFMAAEKSPERTILFAAWTAEEQGLLGSEYYVSNPLYPLSNTVANINIDALSPGGRTEDMTVVGFGQSELDDYAEVAAAKLEKTITPDPNPSAGGFFRSDHFNFVKAGVPALYAGSGSIYVDTSVNAQAKRASLKGTYHSPSDEITEDWDVSGIIEHLKILFDIGYKLSMEETFPDWEDDSEFKQIER